MPVFAIVYDIPSQPLANALKSLSEQSDLQVFSTPQLTKNKHSHPLNGKFNAEQALTILLGQSGLTYKKLGSTVFVIIKNKYIGTQKQPLTPSFELEEMLITARKRTEPIQTTPLSVAAFTETKLQRLQLAELPELSKIVPNLTIVPSPPISGNTAAAAVFIRGVGQLDFTINVDPGVGTYVDGVYLARSVGSLIDLIDLERIEVLRGPQGTLFGRNTVGGALHLISKQPEQQHSSIFSITVGSDQRQDAKIIVNSPLTEHLLGKISLLRRSRDGYVTDGLGQDLGNDNSVAMRSQLLWQPHSQLEFKLIIDATHDRENGSPNVALNLFSSGQIPDSVNKAVFGEARMAGCSLELLNSSRLCFGPAWLTEDKNKTLSTFPAKSNNDIVGTSLTINYDWAATVVKSITAWRDLDSKFQRDSDHSPFNVFATVNEQQQNQFSQEFQLQGTSLNERLYWLSGVYYLQERASEFSLIFLPNSLGIPIVGLFDHWAENKSWAVYGETTYDITTALHLTLGSRYTVEQKKYASQQVFASPNNSLDIISQLVDEPGQSLRFKELTSRITLSYHLAQRLMVYSTVSQGFKSGGFNGRYLSPSPNLRAITYQPEYVTQYEAGIKYYNKDNTLQLNSAIFSSDYEDIQVSTNPDLSSNATITQNAAEAEVSGFELELHFSPSATWLIEGGLGYLNARYQSLGTEVSIDKSNDFAWVPQWSGTVALSYITRIKEGVILTPRLAINYQSETQGTAENEKEVRQNRYSLVDFSVILNEANHDWSVAFGISNLTDQSYLISANQNQALGYSEGIFARGKQWWFTMEKKF